MNTIATAKTALLSKYLVPVMLFLTMCALAECAFLLAITGRIL